ncbi:unnamed protein product [Prunus armeniaca]
MTAWVRINGLNVEYFCYDVMEKIGNLIGTTIKVDANTMSQARAKQQAADSVDTEVMEMNITNKIDELQVDSPATLAVENLAKIHGEWMLMKTRNFKKKILNDSGKGTERNPKNSNYYNGSWFNLLNEEGKISN